MKTASLYVCLALSFANLAGAEMAPPHLHRQGSATQLIVKDQPLLLRAGELGNSSAEPGYLHPFWPKLKAMRLNGLVAPVYWNLIEPQEGQFDFSTVDGLINEARQNDFHLVLLWFGSWKNSMSCYVPSWVKTNDKRFPRSRDSAGHALEILSPFVSENSAADSRAFAALMRHLKETDGDRQTVVMVQVENEIGMIPEARDHSAEADKLFSGAVPAELIAYLSNNYDTLAPELRAAWRQAGGKKAGTWTEVFGPGYATDEIFIAWHFARYTEVVTRAGKKEYPLPMYTNAALIRPGHLPGQYPSGGPLPHLFDVWRASAPSLDLLAPDIYFQNYAEWARRYAQTGALIVPETLRSSDASARVFYTFGGLNAMGFSPFGIESISEPAAGQLTSAYQLIDQLTPLILAHQGRGTMTGLLPEGPEQRQPQQVWMGGYVALVSFEHGEGPALADGVVNAPGAPPSFPTGGLIIATGPDEFLLAGVGITAVFSQRSAAHARVGLDVVEEGHFADGQWVHERFLNGDETNQGRQVRIPPGHFEIQRVKLYRYE